MIEYYIVSKGLQEGNGASVYASLFLFGLSVIAAYDAYKTTHTLSKTVGAFLAPIVWLTLFKEWGRI